MHYIRKTMMRNVIKPLLFCGLVLSGCGPFSPWPMDHNGDAVISPSGKYAISGRINRTDLIEITPISDEMSIRAEILKAKKY
jgi:hypothetical protein